MRYVFLGLAMLVLAGCRSMHVVESGQPSAYAEINERAQHREARVLLADGTRVRAAGLQVMADSASYYDAGGRRHVVATADIRRVAFPPRRGRGALQGLGIGALIGAGGGALVGLIVGLNCGSGDGICGPGLAAIYGINFGALGGQVGLVTGAVRGSRTVYHFAPEKRPRSAEQGAPAKRNTFFSCGQPVFTHLERP